MPELERATLARIYGVSDPHSVEDPAYVSGLREAVSAAIAYGIAGITGRAEQPPPVPPELVAQARFAAKSRVPLDTVLRRYFAGYALLGDFVIEVTEESAVPVDRQELRQIWRSEAALLDRLLTMVAAEYRAEFEDGPRSTKQRRVEQVRRLLDGELLEAPDLGYELDAWHIAILATGPGTMEAVRHMAGALDRELLLAQPEEGTVWAWLGGRHRISSKEVLGLVQKLALPGLTLALGEPGHGIQAWRLSHRQAKAALPIALTGPPCCVRYTDVALLAAALRDDVLAGSLEEIYLAPFCRQPDGGVALRETIQAYFAAGRNVSSAAAALGMSRPTVKSRLSAAEEILGVPLHACAAELETALRLKELTDGVTARPSILQPALPS